MGSGPAPHYGTRWLAMMAVHNWFGRDEPILSYHPARLLNTRILCGQLVIEAGPPDTSGGQYLYGISDYQVTGFHKYGNLTLAIDVVAWVHYKDLVPREPDSAEGEYVIPIAGQPWGPRMDYAEPPLWPFFPGFICLGGVPFEGVLDYINYCMVVMRNTSGLLWRVQPNSHLEWVRRGDSVAPEGSSAYLRSYRDGSYRPIAPTALANPITLPIWDYMCKYASPWSDALDPEAYQQLGFVVWMPDSQLYELVACSQYQMAKIEASTNWGRLTTWSTAPTCAWSVDDWIGESLPPEASHVGTAGINGTYGYGHTTDPIDGTDGIALWSTTPEPGWQMIACGVTPYDAIPLAPYPDCVTSITFVDPLSDSTYMAANVPWPPWWVMGDLVYH